MSFGEFQSALEEGSASEIVIDVAWPESDGCWETIERVHDMVVDNIEIYRDRKNYATYLTENVIEILQE